MDISTVRSKEEEAFLVTLGLVFSQCCLAGAFEQGRRLFAPVGFSLFVISIRTVLLWGSSVTLTYNEV